MLFNASVLQRLCYSCLGPYGRHHINTGHKDVSFTLCTAPLPLPSAQPRFEILDEMLHLLYISLIDVSGLISQSLATGSLCVKGHKKALPLYYC